MRTDLLNRQIASQNQLGPVIGIQESQIAAQLDSLDGGIAGLQKQMTETQSRLGETQAQVHKVLQEQALLAQEKDLLLMRKHTAEELKNPQKRKQFFEKEINSIQL